MNKEIILQEFDENGQYIGNIGNYYGGLKILKYNEKYYWDITGYGGDDPQEITEDLYNELLKFQNASK